MRTLLSFLLMCVFCCQSRGQGFYPLQQDNIWQYHSSDPADPFLIESRITGDTTLINGKTYVLATGFTLGSAFLRQEDSKLLAYDKTDSSEYVLFDFTANAHDTVSQHKSGNRTIVLTSKYYDSTSHKRYWHFTEFQGKGPGSYGFFDWTIQDSLGLTYLTVEPGNSYYLLGARINGVLIGTITSTPNYGQVLPENTHLLQNYPNPFNPFTTFSFVLPAEELVHLTIIDILGREIATITNDRFSAGEHQLRWNAEKIPSGIYFYRMQTGHFSQTRKLILLK